MCSLTFVFTYFSYITYIYTYIYTQSLAIRVKCITSYFKNDLT